MKSKSLGLGLALSFAVLMVGCATPAQKRVDKQMQKESGVSSQSGLRMKGYQAILDSQDISKKQREDMLKLYAKTSQRIMGVRSEMGKLKGVLFQNLLKPNGKETDLNVVKRRLSRLNDEKLDIMLDALASARTILGKQLNEKILVPFMDEEGRVYLHDPNDPMFPHVLDQEMSKKYKNDETNE